MTSVSDKHYTPAQLAEAWGLSPETIRELFRNEPGVLKIGKPPSRFKLTAGIKLKSPEHLPMPGLFAFLRAIACRREQYC
jgi:hypothetical protein